MSLSHLNHHLNTEIKAVFWLYEKLADPSEIYIEVLYDSDDYRWVGEFPRPSTPEELTLLTETVRLSLLFSPGFYANNG